MFVAPPPPPILERRLKCPVLHSILIQNIEVPCQTLQLFLIFGCKCVGETSPVEVAQWRLDTSWQHGARSKHARLCTSRARYGRGSFEYRREPVWRPRSSADLRPKFKAKNGLKSLDCRPNIDSDWMFADARSIYWRPVYELCDLFTSSATCLRTLRPQNSPLENHWIGSRFRCPANVGRSLKIMAEPAVIEQTPAVFLAKMPFLDRREVGRAPFWICDGPFKELFFSFSNVWFLMNPFHHLSLIGNPIHIYDPIIDHHMSRVKSGQSADEGCRVNSWKVLEVNILYWDQKF